MNAARTHKNSRSKKYKDELKHRADKVRPCAAKRGYDYKWYKMTATFRKTHVLCEICLKKGLIVPGVVVDHVIPHKGNYKLFVDPTNWQRLCISCHSIKTNKKDGGFGNPVRS